MQTAPPGEVIIVLGAVAAILVFFGFTFIVMLLYYNNRKKLAAKEQQLLKETFDRQLLQAGLEVRDQTFNDLSQEIHDNVGQTLSLAKLQLNMLDYQDGPHHELLQELKTSISRALVDLKEMAAGMSSERIKFLGLVELIDGELQRIGKTGLLHTVLEKEGKEKDLEYRQKLILFRIVQESLQNIIRHARAKEIRVRISYTDNRLQIIVADDGVGFATATKFRPGGGLGLQHIVSRAALLNGQATITSAPGSGTRLVIAIPL